ncbi:MAG: hypothetical protein ACRCYP_01535 [Alphaproteobacteria bacterium]
MQQEAYLIFKDSEIQVLMQSKKYGVSLKLRKGSRAGTFLQSESEYLKDHPEKGYLLLEGKTISL